MLCEKCNLKQATVHMQQIVNGTKKEMHLCQDCSVQVPLDSPISIEALFNGLLGSFLGMPTGESVKTGKPGCYRSNIRYEPCHTCGMTFESFQTDGGKLGCANCYKAFTRELMTILKNVQASIKHEGKFPQKFGKEMFHKKEANRLRGLMRKAIDEENFEEAARLRDEIKTFEVSQPEEGV